MLVVPGTILGAFADESVKNQPTAGLSNHTSLSAQPSGNIFLFMARRKRKRKKKTMGKIKIHGPVAHTDVRW